MRHRDFGLLVCDAHRATPGYTLFTPIHGKTTYLIGLRGDIVHQWEHPLVSGPYAYLLDNGNLLWAGRLPEGPQHMGGRGGLIREYDWDGKVVWEYRQLGQHHDFRRLPNGNTIFLGWEVVPPEIEKRVPGGLPGTLHADGCMYGDYIHEVTPDGKVVWEWHACRDMEVEKYTLSLSQHRDEFAHANAISPLPNGDIYISFRRLNMIALIDRQTRKLKWEHRDDSFGMQHDCEPLANGNVTLFANGTNITTNPFSRVIELDPRTNRAVWEYRGKPTYTFFSPHISGAQRLGSGNTLICEGQWGRLFEVTPEGDIVWEYVSPFMGPDRFGDPSNEVFRAYRYAADSPQLRGRVRSIYG
ncbi:MAG: aryl-sulfate sulfotransferase [Xanthobacteraceae bacterium]